MVGVHTPSRQRVVRNSVLGLPSANVHDDKECNHHERGQVNERAEPSPEGTSGR